MSLPHSSGKHNYKALRQLWQIKFHGRVRYTVTPLREINYIIIPPICFR